MADFSDVMDTLVLLIQSALYPSGVDAGSPLGINFRIYRGNPTADVLDTDLQAGFETQNGRLVLVDPTARICHVMVNAWSGGARVARPYVFQRAQVVTPGIPTLTVAVAGHTVTLGGAIAAGQGASVAVNGFAFGATAAASDTLTTLATELAAAISAGVPATAAGAVVTIPSSVTLKANVFATSKIATELARESQALVIRICTAGRDLRDAVGKAIRTYLAGQVRFTLPDGFTAYMLSCQPISVDDDKPSKELNFERFLYFSVQFPTTDQDTAATLAIAQTNIETPQGAALATVIEA
jgi:hypothetical protein